MNRKKHTIQNQSKENDNNQRGISPEIATIIKELPEDKRNVIIREFSIKQSYSGPLPTGENIRIYDEVIPNGGDRLMKTVERQLEHRISTESKSQHRVYNQSSTGQWMAFIIAMFFGLVAWDLAKSGREATASILGTIDLVALVTVFITGRFSGKKQTGGK